MNEQSALHSKDSYNRTKILQAAEVAKNGQL